MNKQMPFSKGVIWLSVLILLPLIFCVGKTPTLVVEAADQSYVDEGQSCTTQRLTTSTANDTMPVPDACLNGLCKMVIYANDIVGAFADGYSWEVYYYQETGSDIWVGGPNILMAGVEFSNGYGENGNGVSEGVFLNGDYGDGYIRIMDDGPTENDPYLWTIESRGDSELTSASLTVCSLPGTTSSPQITTSQSISVPSFCIDNMCTIIRYSYASFGVTGGSLSLPVYYYQNGSTGEWMGGPSISLGSVDFSGGYGDNGDGSPQKIFGGGATAEGGEARLYDDGSVGSTSTWEVDFTPASDLDWVYYWFIPMTCTQQTVTVQYTNLATPSFCIDDLCTIVRWTDAYFGAFGPGLSWSVNYKQDSNNNTWFGGPHLSMAGISLSDGFGLNGDSNSEAILDGGRTSEDDYVVLRDDSFTAGEMSFSQWNIVFKNLTDLSEASYFICSNSCEETILQINKAFMPILQH